MGFYFSLFYFIFLRGTLNSCNDHDLCKERNDTFCWRFSDINISRPRVEFTNKKKNSWKREATILRKPARKDQTQAMFGVHSWRVYDDWRFHSNRLLRSVFQLFSVFFEFFFSVFPLCLQEEDNNLIFCASFDWVCFLEQIHVFFDVVIVNCMTAGSGFRMAASKIKMAGLWRHCDVIIRHNWHMIDPIC